MLEVRPIGAAPGADIVGVDLSAPLTSAEFGAMTVMQLDESIECSMIIRILCLS
jgi:hypothetical protein